jgi:hypothetical protein
LESDTFHLDVRSPLIIPSATDRSQ